MDNLVRNETLKLQANALDRISTAFVTVGVLAPIAAAIYNAGTSALALPLVVGSALVCILIAFILHWSARSMLRGLRQ